MFISKIRVEAARLDTYQSAHARCQKRAGKDAVLTFSAWVRRALDAQAERDLKGSSAFE